MIQIRHGVFETNSSSTHSICIPKKTKKVNDFIRFEIGEYGWEYAEVYDTPSYLYTAILGAYPYDESMKKINQLKSILNEHGIGYQFEKPIWRDYGDGYKYLDNGYIDHVDETCEFVEAVLNNEDMLLRYLADGVVFTGNDNQGCYPFGCYIELAHEENWDDNKRDRISTPHLYHDEKNYDYFYKGN